MAIPWTTRQRVTVEKVLEDHPPKSNRCREAAELILPVATQLDRKSRIRKIVPADRAPYVVPKIQLDDDWYHHYTTEVVAHYVDALTGADGMELMEYLRERWVHPDGLSFEAP